MWIADVLPHDTAEQTGAMMEQGTKVLKETLKAQTVAAGAGSGRVS